MLLLLFQFSAHPSTPNVRLYTLSIRHSQLSQPRRLELHRIEADAWYRGRNNMEDVPCRRCVQSKGYANDCLLKNISVPKNTTGHSCFSPDASFRALVGNVMLHKYHIQRQLTWCGRKVGFVFQSEKSHVQEIQNRYVVKREAHFSPGCRTGRCPDAGETYLMFWNNVRIALG